MKYQCPYECQCSFGCMWYERRGWPDRNINLILPYQFLTTMSTCSSNDLSFCLNWKWKFEVKTINKCIGNYLNGEMTPQWKRFWSDRMVRTLCIPADLTCLAQWNAEAKCNSTRRAVQLQLNTLHCLTCNDLGLFWQCTFFLQVIFLGGSILMLYLSDRRV